MDEEDETNWGDEKEDEYFMYCSQPTSKPAKRTEEEKNATIDIKEEVEEVDWGGEDEDEIVYQASQITENNIKSPPTPATGGSSGAMPVAASSPPIIESRAISFLQNMKHESESRTRPVWNPNASGVSMIESEYQKMQKMEAENLEFKQRLYALEGENTNLRRKIETTISAKNQEIYDRVHKQMEEKKKEAEMKREAAVEKEKLNSELASQKMEVLKLQWKVKHSKTRDMSMSSQMSPQPTSTNFPTAKSVLGKGRPPVPKFFMSPETVSKRLMKLANSENEKQAVPDTRDFSLRKPPTLSDYDNDEYKWETNEDDEHNDCFLNLSNNSSNSSNGRMEDDEDDDSDSSSCSEDSCADWELELAQNPLSPVRPKEFIPSNVDAVIGRLKQVPSGSQNLPSVNDKEEEEKRNSILEKLSDLATSRAPWVQTFSYIKKNVEHRFESLKTLVADVARLTPRVIADVEIGIVSSDVEIQSEEGRLWKWYLRHIDKKNQECGGRVRAPSHMPSNCDAGPSMQFIEFINHMPTEPVSAGSLLSHVKTQLDDLIRITDIKNEWRIYERNNLETFLKLLMWASELLPYVLEEENSPEIVRSHLPHWPSELRSWTAVLLDIGKGDFLFHGEFRRTILTLVLEILANIMKAGYFHPTTNNYMLLSNILTLTCSHCSQLTCKHLMDICTVLKYGFKDKHFINLLCEGDNNSLCLMDNISNGFLTSFVKEGDRALKAKMFFEYVSTLNLLMHKNIPVYYSSKLSRAKLIDKKSKLEVDSYPSEELELSDSSQRAWLDPNNWEDPDKCKALCQCRKILCGNVIIMFSDILPLWREAIYEAEDKLLALQRQHKLEDEEFLKEYENGKRRKQREHLEEKEIEKLTKAYRDQFEAYKKQNKFFNDSKLSFTCDKNDLPKVEELMKSLQIYENEMEEYQDKKETLISRRKDYEKDIMTQGLLDNEVFSNWTQVGKLLRKRLGVNLPWWLKRYERESTIFDQALEVGMLFMYHFLNCSNLASALGDEGLRDFLIVSIILKANSEDFLISDRMAPIIRELTTINNPQYPDDVSSIGSDQSAAASAVPLHRSQKSHKLVYENGKRILKISTFNEEHVPDLKQSDLNRQKTLIDSEKKDLMNESFTFRSLANKAEKSRIMETDNVIFMRESLKRKNIEEIIRPTGNQANALRKKQMLHPFRKASCVDEGSRYLNENGEDQTPQRHKRDKCIFADDGRSYSSFGTIDINYVSETERKFFMGKSEEMQISGSESLSSLNEDSKIDKEDLKKYLS